MARSGSLGTLKVFINADSSNFDRTLIRTQRSIMGFGRSLRGMTMGFGRSLKGMVAPLLGGLSVAGFVYGAKRMIGSLDEIAKRSKILGVSVETFQKWEFAADRTGTAIDAVANSLIRLNKFIGAAGSGNKAAEEVLSKIGLSYKQLRGLSPEQQFDAINTAVSGVADANERAYLSGKIYGKTAQSLTNFLAEYIALGKTAKGIGLVKSETVQNAELVDDAMNNIKQSIFSVVAESGFVDFLAKAAKEAENIVKNYGKYVNFKGKGGKPIDPDMVSGKDLYAAYLASYRHDQRAGQGHQRKSKERLEIEKAQEKLSVYQFLKSAGAIPENATGKRILPGDLLPTPRTAYFEKFLSPYLKNFGLPEGNTGSPADVPPKPAGDVSLLKSQAGYYTAGSGIDSSALKMTFPEGFRKKPQEREAFTAPLLGALATSGSQEAYKLIAAQSQSLIGPTKQTAENTRKIVTATERTAVATESMQEALDNLDFETADL